MTPVRVGLTYAGLAFAAGAVLGPVRELLLAPRLGGLPAAMVEAAAMLGLLWIAARWVMARIAPPVTRRGRATVALVALTVVLACDVALGLALQASGQADERAPRGIAEQAVVLPLLAWLFVLPFLTGPRHADAVP